MLKQTALTKIGFAFLVIFLFPYTVYAQLNADFTMNRQSGCAPLAVSFTNAVTGASASAAYLWDFGNGNTSALKDPGAVFIEEKEYTVTLTVTDGTQTAKLSKKVTVYKKPVVDFTASLEKGCAPFPVSFSSKAEAGSGTIMQQAWGFGDGFTQIAAGDAVQHTYMAEQKPTVSLTVTNSFGCQATLIKEDYITVLPTLEAAFSADNSVLCTLADAARFTNKSKGPGSLSYEWNFGDGTTSTDLNPSHVFAAAGVFTVKLKVNSSEGCTTSSTTNATINAASFNSNVDIPSLICTASGATFNNTTVPAPTSSVWEFGDGYIYNTFGSQSVYHDYLKAGTYNLKLTNKFGSCTHVYSKTIEVKQRPNLTGFIAELSTPCGAPTQVNFRDTTADAVKWKWASNWPANFESTVQNPTYTFSANSFYNIGLLVTNAAGCTAYTNQPLNIAKPIVQITTKENGLSGQVLSCGAIPIHFGTKTTEKITSYLWDFKDGSTSTEAEPVHTFKDPGYYRVTLTYTTDKGCTYTVGLESGVLRRDRVIPDFKASLTEVCGQTPVTFTNTSVNPAPLPDQYVYYHWNFGDGYFMANTGERSQITRQFYQEGYYTVSLIATDWVCADTIVKTSYIKVSPPFPKIAKFENTCDGTRGEVTFTQTSRQTDSWKWDFGDGTTQTVTTDQPEIKHTYKKTGYYKVVLTNTNGQCTVKDSTFVPVLLKQNPVLSADKTEVCSRDDYLKIAISNLEKNPYNDGYYTWGYGYQPFHNDGTYALSEATYADLDEMPITQTKWNFIPGQAGLRVVTTSGFFHCTDTSNFIPLKIKGPIPGFKLITKSCVSNNIVFFKDTSKMYSGSPIVKWEWSFGNGKTEVRTNADEFSYTYNWPGQYYVNVKVTDATGCTAIFGRYVDVESSSLKASFTSSATTVSPGTTVSFTNTSITSDPDNTVYKWVLGDGTAVSTTNALQTFTTPGTYTVTLTATNKVSGCTDIARVTVQVKLVNAAFTFNSSYLSNSKCPPVLVQFTNTSSNVSKISWDFGDGTLVKDVFNPSHIYTKPGIYKITVTTTSDNGTQYKTVDSVVVKALPVVKLKANVLHGCTAQSISFTTQTEHASAYLWDFGDGNVVPVTNGTQIHHYPAAGVFTPRLIVADVDGCAASVELEEKIVIDSLFVSLNNLPTEICSPKAVSFAPVVTSVAADGAQQELKYHWDFGTGLSRDTANTKTPTFTYQTPATYTVRFKVTSPFGCVKEVFRTITAFQGLGAQLKGPDETCENGTVQFTGGTLLPGQPKWQWIFEDGTESKQQQPPVRTYNTPGSFTIKLVVDNNGCKDTVTKALQVHAKPIVNLSVRSAEICEGASISLGAAGGTRYSWSPAATLSTPNQATTVAKPATATTYTVQVTNDQGCTNTDSVRITVIHPFVLKLPAPAAVCYGNTIALNATGAITYQWINNTAGLSSTSIPNPVAKPQSSTTYSVVGYDDKQCFTDTASIRITVDQLPTVQAGPDVDILPGTTHTLQATGSTDVVQWKWTPDLYLSCTACQGPVAKPTESMIYTVAVRNNYGCTAMDSVAINLLCKESSVYIPSTFTPNRDGKNDLFRIRGNGIRMVKSFRIYNRWGEMVFERTNFTIDDANAAWNGIYKGYRVPVGTYIYFAEMSCNEKDFIRKGAVTVVY